MDKHRDKHGVAHTQEMVREITANKESKKQKTKNLGVMWR